MEIKTIFTNTELQLEMKSYTITNLCRKMLIYSMYITVIITIAMSSLQKQN